MMLSAFGLVFLLRRRNSLNMRDIAIPTLQVERLGIYPRIKKMCFPRS